MWFAFIDHWFPDPVAPQIWQSVRSSLTWKMASAIVAFPIFAFVMRTVLGEAAQNPERLESGVRRWLTYIALLLTAVGVVSDLIVFLNSFLEGGLTIRFVLKVATVLVICGAIFVYYLWSLHWARHEELQPARKQSMLVGTASLALLVLSFFIALGIAGMPSTQRKMEADERRAEALRRLATDIFSWPRITRATDHKQAPLRLSDVVGADDTQVNDPETKRPYEYIPGSGTDYQPCAVFSTSNTDESVFWKHRAGRTCFKLDVMQMPPWP